MPNNYDENHELVCYFLVHFLGPVVFVIILFSYFLWILITTVQDSTNQTILPRHTILGFSITLFVFAPVLLVAHWVFFHFYWRRHPHGGGVLPPRQFELEHLAGILRPPLDAIQAALPSQQPGANGEEAIRDPDRLRINSLDTARPSFDYRSPYSSSFQDDEPTTPRGAFRVLESGMPEPQSAASSLASSTLTTLPTPLNVPMSLWEDRPLDDIALSKYARHSRHDCGAPRVHFDGYSATKHDKSADAGGADARRWRAPADARSLTDHPDRARRSLSYLRTAADIAANGGSAAGSRNSSGVSDRDFTPYNPSRGSHLEGIWVIDGPVLDAN